MVLLSMWGVARENRTHSQDVNRPKGFLMQHQNDKTITSASYTFSTSLDISVQSQKVLSTTLDSKQVNIPVYSSSTISRWTTEFLSWCPTCLRCQRLNERRALSLSERRPSKQWVRGAMWAARSSGTSASILSAHQVTSMFTSDRHWARWPSQSICVNLEGREQGDPL